MCERTDGFKYEGQWMGNLRHGYGCTSFPDGTVEEGKYKHNVMVGSGRKAVISMKSGKFREKIDHAVHAAKRAMEVAKQKADIAVSR